MRHGKKINHLGRTSSHRKALLANLAISLIMHKRIKTTVAKAKALRKYVEPLINRSKDDTTHSRRTVFSYLQNKEAVTELFREISQKVANRPGGYTRILKLGARIGDAAEICYIELVDYNENMLSASKEAKKKSTRRSRGKGSTDATTKPGIEKPAKTEGKAKQAKETPKETVTEQLENVVKQVEEVVEAAEKEVVEAAEEVVEKIEQKIETVEEKPEVEEVTETIVEETPEAEENNSTETEEK